MLDRPGTKTGVPNTFISPVRTPTCEIPLVRCVIYSVEHCSHVSRGLGAFNGDLISASHRPLVREIDWQPQQQGMKNFRGFRREPQLYPHLAPRSLHELGR
jgi:hypothetical protein